MIGTLVGAALRWDLARAFSRIAWVGTPPRPSDGPLVLYANHQNWFDGHLLWRVARGLQRPYLVWMEERDRYPVLALQGAMPFPPNDGPRRARTIRETTRRMRRDPAVILGYFPEGRLHADTEPLAPWEPEDLVRLARLLPTSAWRPLGIATVSAGARRPVALLNAGQPHPAPDGRERDRLNDLIREARSSRPSNWCDL